MAISISVPAAKEARVTAAFLAKFGPAQGGVTNHQWVEKKIREAMARIVAEYEADVESAAQQAAITAAVAARQTKYDSVVAELNP